MSLYEYRAVIVRWIDGDSVVVNIDLGFRHWMHDEHLRLVGINAPDKQPAKGKATAVANQLCPVGSPVIVRTEKDKGDKYGRWLATIWTAEVGSVAVNVNEAIVRHGAAVPWDGSGVRPEATV